MNARTIQHPGVLIREIDMSLYTALPLVVNNAYMIGFADRGPIYDYSWITTKSEFLKVYGEPQSEALKYLYYAAMSVLNNGGTPIIARMPYDNKQCKAYKGIAIRYAGVTSDYPEDTNPDDDIVYGWSNSPQKNGDFFPDFNDQSDNSVKPLHGSNAIPLSANVLVPLSGVANLLGLNDSPEEILYKLAHNITINGKKDGVDKLTLMNLVYALNPVSEALLYGYLTGSYSSSKLPGIDKIINTFMKDQDFEAERATAEEILNKLGSYLEEIKLIKAYNGLKLYQEGMYINCTSSEMYQKLSNRLNTLTSDCKLIGLYSTLTGLLTTAYQNFKDLGNNGQVHINFADNYDNSITVLLKLLYGNQLSDSQVNQILATTEAKVRLEAILGLLNYESSMSRSTFDVERGLFENYLTKSSGFMALLTDLAEKVETIVADFKADKNLDAKYSVATFISTYEAFKQNITNLYNNFSIKAKEKFNQLNLVTDFSAMKSDLLSTPSWQPILVDPSGFVSSTISEINNLNNEYVNKQDNTKINTLKTNLGKLVETRYTIASEFENKLNKLFNLYGTGTENKFFDGTKDTCVVLANSAFYAINSIIENLQAEILNLAVAKKFSNLGINYNTLGAEQTGIISGTKLDGYLSDSISIRTLKVNNSTITVEDVLDKISSEVYPNIVRILPTESSGWIDLNAITICKQVSGNLDWFKIPLEGSLNEKENIKSYQFFKKPYDGNKDNGNYNALSTAIREGSIYSLYLTLGKKLVGIRSYGNETSNGTTQSEPNFINPNVAPYDLLMACFNKFLSVMNEVKNKLANFENRSLYLDIAGPASGDIKFFGVSPSTLGIEKNALRDLYNQIGQASYIGNKSGLTEFIKDTVLGNLSAYEFNDNENYTISGYHPQFKLKGITSGQALINYKALTTLLSLYNSPKFWNLQASIVDSEDIGASINQAIIDAKLLQDPSIGYKKAIFLDSKLILISNYQYDDLVTTQRFTNGADLSDPDATEDPNFKYRNDIRAANFVIIDKNKSIATGEGSNEGYFVTIIDPYDAMKAQRLLNSPYSLALLNNTSNADPLTSIDYWIEQNKVEWKKAISNLVDRVNLIQHVFNADNILIGLQVGNKKQKNLMDSWSVPLTGGYYDDSISKNLSRMFKGIPLADIKPGQKTGLSLIDKIYSTHIAVAVCKTVVDPANGKITVAIIESFFGSLFNERDPQSGKNLYIGDVINLNSNYILFYKNNFVKNPYGEDQKQLRIPQIYLKNSQDLKNAADTAAIDLALYDVTDSFDTFKPSEFINISNTNLTAFTFDQFCDLYDQAETLGSALYFAHKDFLNFVKKLAGIAGQSEWPKNGVQLKNKYSIYKEIYNDYFVCADKVNFRNDALVIVPSDFTSNLQLYSYNKMLKDLNFKANIFIFDKTDTVLYHNHPVCYFNSFSRKDAQKIIANTTGIIPASKGNTSSAVAKNFLVDMDRCIKFVKNIDDVSIFFVCDAGLSTIAQFCDDIVWDYFKKQKPFEPVTGGWITQTYDPENDQNASDREITSIEDVDTWRRVVGKLDELSKETRKDCMTIIDAPRQLTLDGAAPKVRRSRPTNEWLSKIGDKLKFISGINSSYTAGYYNWLRTTDEFTGKSFWLPPTCKVIGNLMYLNILNLPWLAPAGFNYGVINGIHGVSHNPGYKELDQIYLKCWNYIKQYPYEGFVIEGQKTTLTKNSAFNRINVRTLFLDLERFVYNVSKNFKYQVNNQYTRLQYVQTIAPKFSEYKSRGGLYDFKIICDETNNTWETIDQNLLRATIYIKPARLIEFILVDFVCTKSGANFELLT